MAKRTDPSSASATPSKSERRQAALAELRREQDRRRRSRLLVTTGIIAAFVAVIAVLVFVGIQQQGGSGAKTTGASSALVDKISTIPAATYDSVGTGATSNPPAPLSGSKPLTTGGKPRVLYVGAEYCPYCAAERWAMVTALSRFGTFSNLGQTTSSHADVYPDTPTLSFHGSTFSSPYLSFKGYETQSNQVQGNSYAPLDKLSGADGVTFDTYDRPPYLGTTGSIPFIDFGGKYASQGASYSPQLLHGLTHRQVAAAIADPKSPISQAVLGTANTFSAILCQLTHDRPSNVCTSSAVTAATVALQHP